MDSVECQHYLHVLQKNKNSRFRKTIIKHAPNSVIQALAEICFNTLKGNLELSPQEFKRLKRHKKALRLLSSPKLGTVRKRELLQKGGFLSLIVSTLLGILLPKLFEQSSSASEDANEQQQQQQQQ